MQMIYLYLYSCIISLFVCLLFTVHRQGQSLENEVMTRLCRMLSSLGSYAQQFEVPFLRDSRRFFTSEGNMLLTGGDSSSSSSSSAVADPARFLSLVDRRLREASEMTLRGYLDASTHKPLLEAIESCLLRPHVSLLVERGFRSLLLEDRVDDLRLMFILFDRVGCLDLLKQGWATEIRYTL